MKFEEHLRTFLEEEVVNKLLNSQKEAELHCIKINSLKVKDFNEIFNDVSSLKENPLDNESYYYKKEEYELGKDLLFIAGAYYIQDAAAMLPVKVLDVKEEDKVLDMCAAPGGKSFDALVAMKDKGLLVCNDLSNPRAKTLASNIEKYGFKNAIVLNDDSSKYKKNFIGFFDKIILDAPCSGSAMFRKNDEVEEDWTLEKVLACKEIQLRLLEDAYEMLKEEGRLVYSTCSFSIQENEEVIQEFTSKHNDMIIIPIELNKSFNDTLNPNGGLRLYPFNFDGEGQTMYLLEKRGSTGFKKPKLIESNFLPKEVTSFLDKIKFEYNKKKIICVNNKFFISDFDKVDLKGIRYLKYGMMLGEYINNRFEPAHELAMYHGLDKTNFVELTEEEAKDYLKGLTISKEGNKGYCIASYKGLALGWAKLVNNQLKNHLPKGLRLNIK